MPDVAIEGAGNAAVLYNETGADTHAEAEAESRYFAGMVSYVPILLGFPTLISSHTRAMAFCAEFY